MNCRFEMAERGSILADKDFSLRHKINPAELIKKIRVSGFIQPLFGEKRSSGGIKLVSGFRRVAAAVRLGIRKIPVLFVAQDEVGSKNLFRTALLLNDFSSFEELDQAVIVRKAREVFGFEWREVEEIALLAGLPPSKKVLEEYETIGKMPEAFLAQIEKKKISFKSARALLAFPPEIRDFLVREVLEKCDWSASELVIALEWLADLSRRDGASVKKIVSQEPFSSILNLAGAGPLERGKKFMEVLKKVRYPLTSVAEERFRQIKTQVEVEAGIRIEKAPYFEEDWVAVNLKFRSSEEFRRLTSAIAEKESLFKELFHLVQ